MLFMIGMMVTDGANGLWLARLLRKSSQRALIASRVMGLSIAFLSLAVAGLGLAKCFVPTLAIVLESASPLMGVGILGILLGSFGLAVHLSRASQAA
jgi:high-affinity nickel-transport protein